VIEVIVMVPAFTMDVPLTILRRAEGLLPLCTHPFSALVSGWKRENGEQVLSARMLE